MSALFKILRPYSRLRVRGRRGAARRSRPNFIALSTTIVGARQRAVRPVKPTHRRGTRPSCPQASTANGKLNRHHSSLTPKVGARVRVTQRPSISTSLYKLSCLLSRCVARCHNHDRCSFSIHCSVVRRSCVAAAALANAPLARTQREPRCCCLCPGQRPALNASGACRLLDLGSLGLQTVTVLAPGKPAAAPGSRLKFTVVRPRTITRPSQSTPQLRRSSSP